MKTTLFSISALMLLCAALQAAEIKVSSPDGKAVITVTDTGGLSYAVLLMVVKWWPSRALASSRTALTSARMSSWANLPHARFASRIPCSAVTRRQTIIAAKPRCPSAAPPVKITNSTCAPTTTAWRCARGWRRSRAGKSTAKSTEWKMPGNPLAWFQTDFGSYEGICQSSPLNDLSDGRKLPLPITFTLPGGGYALVTEANLLNYSDLGVQAAADHSLRAYFHAPSDRNGWTDRRRRGSAVARHAAGARSQCAGEQRPHSQSLSARAAGTCQSRLDSARSFLVAMVVERRADLR